MKETILLAAAGFAAFILMLCVLEKMEGRGKGAVLSRYLHTAHPPGRWFWLSAAEPLFAVGFAKRASDCESGLFFRLLFLEGFAACLYLAAVMDASEKKVYRYFWYYAAAAALGFIGFHTGGISRETWIEFVVFCLLQRFVFSFLYGTADCCAYVCCAICLSPRGRVLSDMTAVMAVSFFFLTVRQALRRNIAADGNLKEPVAMIPYIVAGFWVWVDFISIKWYI